MIDYSELLKAAGGYGNLFQKGMDIFGGWKEGQGLSDAYDKYGQGLASAASGLGGAYDQARGALNPYEQVGRNALNQYYGGLQGMSDPTAYYNKIMSGYQQSPLAQFQMQQGTDAINSSAASRGLLGSTAQGRNLMDFSQGLTSRDMGQYFGDISGINKDYLSGLGGLGEMGFRGASSIADLFKSGGQDIASIQAAMAQAQAQKEAQKGSTWGNIFSGVGSLFK